MTITTETLCRFCAGPGYDRGWAWHPFRQDGRIFATSGHVFVSIPDDGRSLYAPHEHEAQSMARIVLSLPAGEGIAIPPLPEPIKCRRCDGARIDPYPTFGRSVCARCDGAGEEPPESGRDGWEMSWWRAVQVGTGRFQARLLRLLQALPGVVIVPAADERSMAGIRFDCGIGGIMPLWRDG